MNNINKINQIKETIIDFKNIFLFDMALKHLMKLQI
jgi:hypothetical protein